MAGSRGAEGAAERDAELWDELLALNRMAFWSAPYDANATTEALRLQWNLIGRMREVIGSKLEFRVPC